jgi:hypothetical protein
MKKSVTIYRDDMNNEMFGNMFEFVLDSLGVDTHAMIDGRYVKRDIDSVTLCVDTADVTVVETAE